MSIEFHPSLSTGKGKWKQEIHDAMMLLHQSLDEIDPTLQILIYNELKDLPHPIDGWKVSADVKEETRRGLKRYLLNEVEPKLNEELEKMDLNQDNILHCIFISQRINALSDVRNIKLWRKQAQKYATEQGIRRRNAILKSQECFSIDFNTPQTWE